MAVRESLLDVAWGKVRWWWVVAGWLGFVAAWSAVVAVRAQVRAHHVAVPRTTWEILFWLVPTLACIVVAAGTVRLAGRLVKPRLAAAGLAVLLVGGQLIAGAYVFIYLAVYVHLWAGGSL